LRLPFARVHVPKMGMLAKQETVSQTGLLVFREAVTTVIPSPVVSMPGLAPGRAGGRSRPEWNGEKNVCGHVMRSCQALVAAGLTLGVLHMIMTRWLAAGTSGLLMLVCLVCCANCIRSPPILRPLSKLVDLRGYVRTEPTTRGRSCQSPPKSPAISCHLLPSRAWYATNCATPKGPQSSSWPIARGCTHDHGRRGSTQLAALATLDKPVIRGAGPARVPAEMLNARRGLLHEAGRGQGDARPWPNSSSLTIDSAERTSTSRLRPVF